MICPKCKKEINEVRVFSEARQDADIDKNGNITDYGSVESISDEAISVECPECFEEIIKHINSF